MIRLLIVDDEKLEVEGIKSTLDYSMLGISELFEANNIRQAKAIFLEHNVDILLCDIEMPQGNGLELLTWVRENYSKTECIFITCHADFHYAKQAIQLGSLDYLLKPAKPAELEKVLLKAIENVNRASQLVDNTRFSKLWLKHQPLLIEHFWLDMLNHKIPSTLDEIRKAALDISLPGIEEIMVLPVLICVQRWMEELNPRDKKIMEFGLKNIAQELILKDSENGMIIGTGQDSLLGLLYLEDPESIGIDNLKKDCIEYVSACHQYIKCDLCCYIGNFVFSYELVKMIDKLQLLDKNNVAHINKVLTLGQNAVAAAEINLPDISMWALLMEQCQKDKLLSEVEKYLKTLVDTMELNANILHQIQQDFIQMMSAFLKSKGIHSRSLFSDERSVELFRQASRSVHCMTQWLVHDIEKAFQYIKELEKSQSVIDKVKKYIALNIDKDMSCEEIASQVYLNPIYLNRIFKKETGLALSEYMQQERLRIARELLSQTNMPVSTVAAHVGYSNFSHFSRMFRKHEGLSPVDFRKQLLK